MSLKDEIVPYLDQYGLVQPRLNTGSNNGVLYLSEYFVILNRLGQATLVDQMNYKAIIESCFKVPGLLMRNPINAGGQEAPDDNFGVASAASFLQDKSLAQDTLTYGYKHYGAFNNVDGTWTDQAFLWRQLQLYSAYVWAAGKTPLFPFRFYTAMVILYASLPTPTSNTDARALAWLLIQVAAPKSWMCRMAAKLWKRRLFKDYLNGMTDVAVMQFGADHPLAKYWPEY